jgi:hypothetical protein
MATQDWQSPNPLADDSPLLAASPFPQPAPGYELRPLSVGEILDRVFSLYRSNFWLLVGISALSAGVLAGMGILQLIVMHFASFKIGSPAYSIFSGAAGLVQMGVYLIAYSLTIAATTSAVNALYLGEPTSLGVALRVARRLWLRSMGISLWQGWSACWSFLLLLVLIPIALIPGLRNSVVGEFLLGALAILGGIAGVVYAVIAYLRNSLAIPAAVVEDLGVRKSMRRSKDLATGRIGRIFLLFLLMYAMRMVTAVITTPLAFVIVRSPTVEHFVMQGIILAVNFLSTTLVGPIAAIGLCLFYFDERVRRDGFDIEMLLRGSLNASPIAALETMQPSITDEPTATEVNAPSTLVDVSGIASPESLPAIEPSSTAEQS